MPRLRTNPISLRLTAAEREMVERAAEATCPGLAPSTWIRAVVIREAERLTQPPTDPEIQGELGRMVRAEEEGEGDG